ncbi:MAG: mechanosensitive ion channel [Myxococcales bacterium]|nr:mechanosensitive ion channel [Myxococcales bacterium]
MDWAASFINVIWVIAVFLGGMLGSKLVAVAIRQLLERAKVDRTLSQFLASVARWTIVVIVGVACLGAFGIETTSFAALIGAAGLAIGLAFQGTLSSVAAGVMLIILRPFKVGELVGIGGQVGVVEEIGIFTTTLLAHANHRLILPNKDVFGAPIENKTFDGMARVDVAVGTDYSADLDRVREVLLAAITDMEGTERPQVYLVELGGSSIDWSVRVWTAPEKFLGVRDQITLRAKKALDAANIGIPFPQMDVHLDQLNKAA